MQRHHVSELGLDLILGTVDVGVVHTHPTYAHKSTNRARFLESIHLAVFREAQGEVPIATWFRRKNLVVMWTIHGFQDISFFDPFPIVAFFRQFHWRIHGVCVVR